MKQFASDCALLHSSDRDDDDDDVSLLRRKIDRDRQDHSRDVDDRARRPDTITHERDEASVRKIPAISSSG